MNKVLTLLACTVALFLTASSLSAADVLIKVDKDKVDFLAGDKLVTTYQISPTYAKPILWPVYAPGDIKVTRDWPMVPLKEKESGSIDHIHQKSVWFCWGDVIPEGLEVKDKIKGIKGVDFWSEAKGHGRIVCTEVGKPVVDKWKGHLVTSNEWRTADGKKIMDETRHLHFYDFGKARLMVLDIRLDATVCPITFGDTKEGAMGVRVHDAIRADKNGKGKIQNAEGKINEKDCWGQISAWCDYSGPIEGKTVGIAVLCDPKNPHPSAWHTRGYGLHAANPFGRAGARFPALAGRSDLVRLAKGDSIHFRYGVLVHEGDTETGRVAEYFDRFVKLRAEEKKN
jgi:hypothetical protein